METEGDACDEPELPLRAAHELPEVVARDVLHDLAAGARDRSVTEHQRDAEDEVAGCPEAVGERAGQAPRQARADRRISRRVERETLPARREGRLQRGQADTRLDGARQVSGLVLEHAIEARRREVLADPERAPVGTGRGEHRRGLVEGRGPHQKRSASPSCSSG